MEWRLFRCGSGAALFAIDSEPGLRLSSRQRVIAEAYAAFSALVDAAHSSNPSFDSGVWLGIDRVSVPCKPPDSGLYTATGQRDDPGCKQSFKCRPSGRIGSAPT